ncbi:hypothetical protein VP01_3231g2 [Puccinia sorghi]|uniref:Uncharacterized protein n=1 Tax=Puccinia sorghi TaxID=27349 RepID=A0A0L6UY42_9BASI|nr:hypothetical protein VP01_3231g2 [Puccinia sorghi]
MQDLVKQLFFVSFNLLKKYHCFIYFTRIFAPQFVWSGLIYQSLLHHFCWGSQKRLIYHNWESETQTKLSCILPANTESQVKLNNIPFNFRKPDFVQFIPVDLDGCSRKNLKLIQLRCFILPELCSPQRIPFGEPRKNTRTKKNVHEGLEFFLLLWPLSSKSQDDWSFSVITVIPWIWKQMATGNTRERERERKILVVRVDSDINRRESKRKLRCGKKTYSNGPLGVVILVVLFEVEGHQIEYLFNLNFELENDSIFNLGYTKNSVESNGRKNEIEINWLILVKETELQRLTCGQRTIKKVGTLDLFLLSSFLFSLSLHQIKPIEVQDYSPGNSSKHPFDLNLPIISIHKTQKTKLTPFTQSYPPQNPTRTEYMDFYPSEGGQRMQDKQSRRPPDTQSSHFPTHWINHFSPL